jgi:hypothetical protein
MSSGDFCVMHWAECDTLPDVARPWMSVDGGTPLRPLVYLDLETTGLDPVENGVCSIGAFAVDAPGNWFVCRTKLAPEEFLDMEALTVNGETTQAVQAWNTDRLDSWHALGLLREWIDAVFFHKKQVMLTGWNVQFDLQFCRPRWAGLYPRPRVGVASRVLDLHSVAAWKFCSQEITSDGVSHLLGVTPERKPHRSGDGMRWGWDVFTALQHGTGMAGLTDVFLEEGGPVS